MVQFWGWASNIPVIIEEIYTSLGEALTRLNLETCKKPTRVSTANNYFTSLSERKIMENLNKNQTTPTSSRNFNSNNSLLISASSKRALDFPSFFYIAVPWVWKTFPWKSKSLKGVKRKMKV